ncbi:class II aldolase/adducin family protein [Oceanospirillum linum]|uniref:Class II aldolase/adducin N-terminal domain-containing protein n=1 Tax=Oceanospirillum linum TaxID=966 RepID=A0A1T1HA58_OCELI|nr:class II aldolase/adducin family protein [Oceanospirillum linum]OOV86607.1 hypothetical protein BTA35_0211970 [Oceanospirillum linum]SEG28524.1 Class II Aldolase and Adducin N-terminal domain-containing protein [Oleiphilus messinensis]SMP26795.1 Class II Aldolase and Adducin N-terminal domain-containing protein [Oceanospirillum linum]
MTEREGVIKYRLDYTKTEACPSEPLEAIQQWRLTLFQLALIGQSPDRYGGLGYGNISIRHGDGFIISGTQTGGVEQLSPEHYALVEYCNPLTNHIVAKGPVKPSSEALTHGTVYALDDTIQAVIHVHSPEIWLNRARLQMAETPADVPYGTPEMAQAVKNIWRQGLLSLNTVFAMAGHEDGVVSFGRDMNEAGMAMLNTFQWARTFELNDAIETGEHPAGSQYF